MSDLTSDIPFESQQTRVAGQIVPDVNDGRACPGNLDLNNGTEDQNDKGIGDLIDLNETVIVEVNKIEDIDRSTGNNENLDIEEENWEENKFRDEGECKSNECINVSVEQKGEEANISYEQKNVEENERDHFNDAKSVDVDGDKDEKRGDEHDAEVYQDNSSVLENFYPESKNEQSHEEIICQVDTKITECKTELNQQISESGSKISTLFTLLNQKDEQTQDMFQSLKNENKEYVDNAVSSTQKFYENINTKISDLKLSFVQKSEMNESLQKSIEDVNQKITSSTDNLDSKIEELEDQLSDLEGRDEQLENSLSTAIDQLREEIESSVDGITKRLAEDRAAKWHQIVEAVKEEAQKIMERIDIVESCEGILRKELEENFNMNRKGIEEVTSEQSRLKNEMEINNKLNKKMIEEIASEQTINEKFHKAINLNIPEFFEKVKKQIEEVIQKYEIKLNDFKNECNKEQEEFMEKIRIMSEKKMQFYEEEIDRLKNSKRSMKQLLEKKDVEINGLKVNVAQCETLNYKLEQEKTVLESNLKEQEVRFYEFDKRYRNKQLSNEEELNRTKDANIRLERQLNIVKSKKKLYKRWIYFLISFLIVSIAYIFFVSFDNSNLLYHFTMGQTP
ncbi:9189_t:CDS:2 [Diversispora eburnea]|uniref:9189_t:CDS:1 n=1 Tax=Diversispora eburnea TaxID=1213867 RepID=A0A9N8YSK3_9GLOM|nr:9189_t:CDS:2 [Diversispora eburnea]